MNLFPHVNCYFDEKGQLSITIGPCCQKDNDTINQDFCSNVNLIKKLKSYYVIKHNNEWEDAKI